jgi:hypothetical protein
MRKIGWGQGDHAMPSELGKDRYFITASGIADDKEWEAGPDDWALFAEMMRDRVNSMREPKPTCNGRYPFAGTTTMWLSAITWPCCR